MAGSKGCWPGRPASRGQLRAGGRLLQGSGASDRGRPARRGEISPWVGAVSGLALWPREWSHPRRAGGAWQTSSAPSPGQPHPEAPGSLSLLRVVPDEKPQGGEVSFGGSVVDRQGSRVCGCGGVRTAVTQQPVHHLGVAEAGSQMQDCGTRIVFVLWKESPSVLKPSPAPVSGSGRFLRPTRVGAALPRNFSSRGASPSCPRWVFGEWQLTAVAPGSCQQELQLWAKTLPVTRGLRECLRERAGAAGPGRGHCGGCARLASGPPGRPLHPSLSPFLHPNPGAHGEGSPDWRTSNNPVSVQSAVPRPSQEHRLPSCPESVPSGAVSRASALSQWWWVWWARSSPWQVLRRDPLPGTPEGVG